MKKLFLLAIAVAFIFTACNNSNTKTENKTNVYYEIDSLLSNASDLVDQNVTLQGVVTHTCSHSGKRCFIETSTPDLTMRVEAGEAIGSFNADLIGSVIEVVGVLREHRIPSTEIDEMESEIIAENKAEIEEGNTEHSCETELQNINSMREWMKNNNKDYYASYYIDGESYKKIEQK